MSRRKTPRSKPPRHVCHGSIRQKKELRGSTRFTIYPEAVDGTTKPYVMKAVRNYVRITSFMGKDANQRRITMHKVTCKLCDQSFVWSDSNLGQKSAVMKMSRHLSESHRISGIGDNWPIFELDALVTEKLRG